MLAKDLKAAVKMVVGSCVSLGILIENKPAKEIEDIIDAGIFDKEINSGKTDTSPDKKKQLDAYFTSIKLQQEKAAKQEAAAKEAEAAAKTAEASSASATGTATIGATKAPVAKSAPVKEEAKKGKK